MHSCKHPGIVGAVRVSQAVTRLTVYRRPQVTRRASFRMVARLEEYLVEQASVQLTLGEEHRRRWLGRPGREGIMCYQG